MSRADLEKLAERVDAVRPLGIAIQHGERVATVWKGNAARSLEAALRARAQENRDD